MGKKKVLVIGANYGLLLAGMLKERDFDVEVFGTKKEVETLNQEGFSFNMNDSYWRFAPSNKLKFINSFNEDNYDLDEVGEDLGWALTTGFPLDLQIKIGYQF